jgi:ADP-heptose:LPS heptosyltransferase
MNVHMMRNIDAHAGVILCFLLSLLGRFFFKKPTRAIRNVLFIELSEMGSAILADPAMRKARRELKANLYFVIFAKNKPSLQILGTVDEQHIFTIREDSFLHLTLDTLKFLLWARRQAIDTVVDLELFSRFTALLTALCGAQNRVGFYRFHHEGLYRGNMLTHRVAYNPHIHIAKNFLAMVNALTAATWEVPFSKMPIADEELCLHKCTITDADKQAMRARVQAEYPPFAKQRIVLINPNASALLIQRRWMPASYAELIRRILHDYADVLVLLTGAPGERGEAEVLKALVDHERCINFAGKSKLQELTHLYAISTLMVTNDSGPAHFAATTELPTFVIFGPETPALYGSLGHGIPIYAGLPCSPCVSAANHRRTACTDNVCLQVITPEQVYQQVSPYLDEGCAQFPH